MIVNQHTRNQKRMYRIHKLEEKIHKQDLLIGSLQQENQKLKGTIETYNILLKSNVKSMKVIEELEKYLRNYIKIMNNNPDVIEKEQIDILHEVLDKLKQLKEEGK